MMSFHGLQVCTGPQCFCFDLTNPKVKAVARRRVGLRQILEKPSVIKIMHDSYVAVAAVYQQLRIRILGVFDTMVS